LKIGDLIYDSYMRTKPHPTVDLRDPKLAEMILQGVRITLACREYFSRRKVVGVIPDHFVYIYSGIITRCALLSGVPVYQVLYCANFFAFAVSCAPGSRNLPGSSPYPFYRQMFGRLSPAEREQAREKGRCVIERRLAGYADGVLSIMGAAHGSPAVQSAYGGGNGKPALQDTGRPRILILLHDFCDGVHNYRDFLFPDFYEWIHFLLKHAVGTEFDWYVKPHPNAARRGVLAEVNGSVLDELKASYPKIHFLEPTTSSRQIIREGVKSMFTGYGTAGHEFAYLGVPVVNAGDNPHIAYDFNLHPRTLEEYAACIAHADSLQVDIRKEDIEEYVYMNYIYCEEELSCGANPMSAEFLASEEFKSKRSRPETLEMLMHRFSAKEKREFADYLDHIPHLAEPLSVEVRLRKTHQAQAAILTT